MKTVINFLTLSVIVIITLFLIKTLDIYYPVRISSTVSSDFSVVGEGKVEVVPDTAYVDAGISVIEAGSVAQVQKSIDDTNNKIILAMQKLGIEKKDIKTSNYSINPNYSYENNKSGITGYNGNANITITVKKIELVSNVIQLATDSGANQIQGARFTVKDPAKYREEARTKAIANAKEQAQKLAASLGIKLGKITNIIENSDNVPPIIYDRQMMAGGGAAAKQSADIEPGSQTITSIVTLFFDKK